MRGEREPSRERLVLKVEPGEPTEEVARRAGEIGETEVVAERLTPRGLYAVNIISNGPDSHLLHSVTLTLQDVFPHVRWFEAFSSPEGPTNTWVLACRAPFTLGKSVPPLSARVRILTDDDAPVEYLVAWELLRAPG